MPGRCDGAEWSWYYLGRPGAKEGEKESQTDCTEAHMETTPGFWNYQRESPPRGLGTCIVSKTAMIEEEKEQRCYRNRKT